MVSAGDGSRDTPFGSIATAIAVATDGSIIAPAKGRYVEDVLLPVGVTLCGACAAETLTAGIKEGNGRYVG